MAIQGLLALKRKVLFKVGSRGGRARNRWSGLGLPVDFQKRRWVPRFHGKSLWPHWVQEVFGRTIRFMGAAPVQGRSYESWFYILLIYNKLFWFLWAVIGPFFCGHYDMRYSTPLRYPGGKAKLTPIVSELLERNGLLGGHYIEPYAGGAGVALHLLMSGKVGDIHLNDLNYPLYCFWESVVNNSKDFLRKLRSCKVTVAAWKRHRSILDNPEGHSMLDVGFAFFFLNRTNRSGIISGRMIGGYEQAGFWKIDARFNKDSLEDRIRSIAKFKKNIHLYNLDACEFVRILPKGLRREALIYFDPPYYEKGQRLYDNFYNHDDHLKVRNTISEMSDANWMVSYDNKPEIRRLYKAYSGYSYDLRYSAGRFYDGSEVIYFSDTLSVPSKEEFLRALYMNAA